MSGAEEREVERQIVEIGRGSVDFHGVDDLRKSLTAALRDGRPLRIKLGMDPSSPDLHLGHAVVLRKLRAMQRLGHLPIFLIGDFTARIGDPSGRKKTRPALSSDEVAANARTYVDQVSRFLDTARAEVRFNSEWTDHLSPTDFIRLCSTVTVARMLERDDFAKRYASGEPISIHEFLYPFVQGYDSVELRADLEIGGTDQTFNLLMGRELQRFYGQAPQAVLTFPLLVGTDGHEKMSKSLGNCISLTDAAEDVYGKVMRISDSCMLDYIDILSLGEWSDLERDSADVRNGGGDPMALKQALAARVVETLHDSASAERAGEHFRRVVQGGLAPEDVPEFVHARGGGPDAGLLEVLERAGLVSSRSEARRLVQQGAVQIDGEPVVDARARLVPASYEIRVGRRRFARVRVD